MKNPDNLSNRMLFISWAPYCSRSDMIAKRFSGTSYLVYFGFLGSNPFTILLKYLLQAIKTLAILLNKRPLVTFVMSPPILACAPVWLYCKLTGTIYVIDAHTAAFSMRRWRRIWFVSQFFCRHAATTVVTNTHLRDIVVGWGGHSTIIADIPMQFHVDEVPLQAGHRAVFVCSFNSDEPIAAMLAAAKLMPEVACYFTGAIRDAGSTTLKDAPKNVKFTDFLPDGQYAGLLKSSDAVVALTNRDHTMQRAAYEAMSLGTPVVTSDWPILRNIFRKGVVFVDNSAAQIAAAVHTILQNKKRFRDQLQQQREERHVAWQTVKAELDILISRRLNNGHRHD